MYKDPKEYGVKDTIVTISVTINDPIDDEEVESIAKDIHFFTKSIGGRILQSPLERRKVDEKILAAFECNSHLIDAVKSYFYNEAELDLIYGAALTINSIEPLKEI